MGHSSLLTVPNSALVRWSKEKTSLTGCISHELGCHGFNDVRLFGRELMGRRSFLAAVRKTLRLANPPYSHALGPGKYRPGKNKGRRNIPQNAVAGRGLNSAIPPYG
jgi:hypothetical protein